MKQHQINLITPRMLERTRAGRRTRRVVAICATLVGAMLLTATHARLEVEQAKTRHESTTIRADRALNLERSLTNIDERMQDVHSFMEEYREVAIPLDATRLIATLTRSLPPSITLVELELNYDDGTGSRRHVEGAARGPRRMVGEIAGIASSDGDIATLVQLIGSRDPFAEVNLDYSRSRSVRDRPARDFRLSFVVDMDHAFEVNVVSVDAVAAGESNP
ncbi:MAG: hypothetical protein CMJ24_02640 [Phycisphaerae bacterium]|nr:hypothetical protein [Phycisphaerae bacterium]|tara:strand:- start:7660 stop:8319 length:660 start_codon:yes stop_codon:yes gene_type:complete